jgi:hypothetical protein
VRPPVLATAAVAHTNPHMIIRPMVAPSASPKHRTTTTAHIVNMRNRSNNFFWEGARLL